jgi:hypothetical protein
MALAIIYLILPALIYLLVVALPSGRPARIGMTLAGLVIGALWLSHYFSVGPLFTGDRNSDAYARAAVWFYTLAWVAAALTQTVGRAIVGPGASLSYFILALVVLILTTIPMLYLLGL